jgi:hypothetical protein
VPELRGPTINIFYQPHLYIEIDVAGVIFKYLANVTLNGFVVHVLFLQLFCLVFRFVLTNLMYSDSAIFSRQTRDYSDPLT